MFLINGSLNGEKTYKNETMTGKELYKVLKPILSKAGISLDKEKIEFNVRMTTDRLGQKHPGARRNLLNTFNVNIDGSEATIKYYRRTFGEGEKKKYDPKKTTIVSGPMVVMVKDEFDLALLLAIHPKNQSSPFWNKSRPHLEIVDRELIAEKQLNQAKSNINFMDQVMNFQDFEELKEIARGIQLRRGKQIITIPNAAFEDFVMLKAQIITLAGQHGPELKKAFFDKATKLRGQIKKLIDDGVVVLDKTSQDGQHWHMNEKYGGSRLVSIAHKQNAHDAIYDYLMNMRNLEQVNDRVVNSAAFKKEVGDLASNLEKLFNGGVLKTVEDDKGWKVTLGDSTLIRLDEGQDVVQQLIEKYSSAPVIKNKINAAIEENL